MEKRYICDNNGTVIDVVEEVGIFEKSPTHDLNWLKYICMLRQTSNPEFEYDKGKNAALEFVIDLIDKGMIGTETKKDGISRMEFYDYAEAHNMVVWSKECSDSAMESLKELDRLRDQLEKIKQVVDAWLGDGAFSSFDCMDNIAHIFNGEVRECSTCNGFKTSCKIGREGHIGCQLWEKIDKGADR